jgi:hypothetical protein
VVAWRELAAFCPLAGAVSRACRLPWVSAGGGKVLRAAGTFGPATSAVLPAGLVRGRIPE